MEKKKKEKKVNRLKSFFDLKWWFYDFVKITGFIPGMLFFRPKFVYLNKESKKEFKRESIMIAANHRGFMDPFIMVGVFYFKRVGVIATKDLFDTKFKNALFHGFRAICIDKDNVGISTFKEVNKIANDGHSVGIFPEGTIVHETDSLNEFKPGVIMMAKMAKLPIYPVYFSAKRKKLSRQVIIIGEKFDLNEQLNGRKPNSQTYAEMADELREKMLVLEKLSKEKYE